MIRIGGLLLTLLALGACVPRSTPPAPVQVPQPAPAPPVVVRPAPAPAPLPALTMTTAWVDAPLTPGSWAYRRTPPGSAAQFGSGGGVQFAISCVAPGQVMLQRGGVATVGNLTVRTSNAARTLSTSPSAGGATATLPASDPLLDAIAFSRGRFSVEAAGAPQLIIPAWPEVARVVEDCRRP